MQVVVGALVMAAGIGLGYTAWRGWRGTLARNRFVGVRTPAAMVSVDAFRLANRVAAPPLAAAAGLAVLGGLAALAAPSVAAFAVVLAVVAVGVLALAMAGGLLGTRAAAALPAGSASARTPCAGCACGGPGSAACAR